MLGQVKDGEVHVTVLDRQGKVQQKKSNPWNDRVIGIFGQERLYRDRKVKPGDVFSYQSFEPELTAVFTTQVEVKDYESVRFSDRKVQRLLRVEAVADAQAGFQPPPLTLWLDAGGNILRTTFKMNGLGQLVLERTSRALATRPTAGVDIGYRQLIPLDSQLPRGLDTQSAVYLITVSDEKNPGTTFARDDHQHVRNIGRESFELHIHPIAQAASVSTYKRPDKKYLASNFFINSADERVRKLAREAVGAETDPWKKAEHIARWVFRNIHKDYSVGFDPADRVARTLEGDCTEHSVLAAAMCRAVGVPSQVAIGLVYTVQHGGPVKGPVLAFHMWTEVWIDGQWRGIDPTMGGLVGAGHLKITASAWDTPSLKPLLPLQRVLGKTRIKLVRVGDDD